MKAESQYIYLRRINAVIDHVNANLNRSHSLDELAGIAHFSKFHFHRVFKIITGETVLEFVKRLRLERAVNF
jgi:AraC family transcriptional regulator